MKGDEDDVEESGVVDVELPAALDGMRLDRVLSMLTGFSRSESQTILRSGQARLNDQVVIKAATPVAEGDRFVVQLPPVSDGTVTPDESVSLDVVLEDEHFIVVNKLAEQVVHPGAGRANETLVAGVLARYPEVQELAAMGLCEMNRPGIVHRLDRGTSGVLVVARTPLGFESLSEQLADRSMERTYLGLVEGHVAEERGVVDAPLGRSARNPTMIAVRSDGRPARTGYQVLRRYDTPRPLTLLRLRLETGRTHQIRVHLSSIQHPVVNDARYGRRIDKRLAPDRFYLHSANLRFRHPLTVEWVEATAPLPADLLALTPEV